MAAKTYAQIMARGANEGFTPYMVAALINMALEAESLPTVRPQMIYNYSTSGQINGTKAQHTTRGYTTAETTAFVNRFVQNRKAKANGTYTRTPAEPQTVEDIDAAVAALLARKSELQGTTNA